MKKQSNKEIMQQRARKAAIKNGKNPDTLFGIDNDGTPSVFDITAFLKLLEFEEPVSFAKALDSIIFSYLGLLCQGSISEELDTTVYNNIYLLKRLRDALMHGSPGCILLDQRDTERYFNEY